MAQVNTVQADSTWKSGHTKGEVLFRNRWVQSTYIGVPLIAAGLAEMGENHHFRSLRNDFMPRFHSEADNWIQYSPAAVMLALKACGVESQSSWKKMIVADALSMGLVTAITRTVKPFAKVERPDGSNHKSFPSGHTATAFMCATMLTKEYGHYSPWVGVGAYTVATTTGVMRMMNNRHWMSDVLAGAGMGIIGTEFGYWLSDIILPGSPRSYDPSKVDVITQDDNPSFFGVTSGFFVPLTQYQIDSNRSLKAATGGTFGFEGAYFLNRHIGVGGNVNLSDYAYIVEGEEQTTGSSHFYTAQAGAYFSTPLVERLFLGAKVLGGMAYYPDASNNPISMDSKSGVCATTGVSLGIRAKKNLDMKIGMDYTILTSQSSQATKPMQSLVFTGTAAVHF